jgi:2-polyprenyl-3-methyl-5-hydroxy-6-metoxy-1,4-benzoquinol methylase
MKDKQSRNGKPSFTDIAKWEDSTLQTKPTAEPRSDYQHFALDRDGQIEKIGQRMLHKMEAIPIPDLKGKSVLDVGCDFGFWSFHAANLGASYVLGLDRNREVRGFGYCDLIWENRRIAGEHKKLSVCNFEHVNLGKQWREFGNFDVVFMFSLYHHIYENVGDHKPIWFWLWRHTTPEGIVLWENPTDCRDVVSNKHISPKRQAGYNKEAILAAAGEYFKAEYIGPAKHEPHREVYRFTRREKALKRNVGMLVHGAGGATKAFKYAENRRMREIEQALGYWPQAGSLNIRLTDTFDWNKGYYRIQMKDVRDRSQGLDSDWVDRWARMYPVSVGGVEGHAFRFEGESYPDNFLEVVSAFKIRDFIQDDMAVVQC